MIAEMPAGILIASLLMMGATRNGLAVEGVPRMEEGEGGVELLLRPGDTPTGVVADDRADESSWSQAARSKSDRDYKRQRIVGGSRARGSAYSFAVAFVDSIGLYCAGSLVTRDAVPPRRTVC